LAAYQGEEVRLAEDLIGQPLGEEARLRLLTQIQALAPGSVTQALHDQIIVISGDDPDSPLLAPALRQLLASDPEPGLCKDPELGEGLAVLARTAPNRALRDLLLDALLHHAPTLEHRLLALELSL
jgi:hypothetical protein